MASCTVRYSTTGPRRVTAVYNGDSNFTGSASGSIQVSVQPLGQINSSMQWLFAFTPGYTTVTSMVLNGVSLGTKVILSCKGRGCPFGRLTNVLSGAVRCTAGRRHCRSHRRGPINLTGAFHRHRLLVGARITIEIRRPGWVGKYYSFVIRSGHVPQVRISCLAPGQSRPGVDC